MKKILAVLFILVIAVSAQAAKYHSIKTGAQIDNAISNIGNGISASIGAVSFSDGAATGTTLTSASSTFTAADTGKYIIIPGAGPGITMSDPTAAIGAGSGATTYKYKVTAVSFSGESLPSSEKTVANQNATLSDSAYNTISWDAVSGAVGYNVYRTTGGTNQGKVNVNLITAVTFNDTFPVAGLTSPAMNRVSAKGTTGATTYAYKVVAKNATGATTASATAGQITNGNATLSATNFNDIVWFPVFGSVSGYDIYRTSGGATQGKIGSTDQNTCFFSDYGLSGTGSVPGANTTAAAVPVVDNSPNPLITTVTFATANTLTLAAAATNAVTGKTCLLGSDATTAINAALANGGRVFIPDGNYLVVSTLFMPSGTVFSGSTPSGAKIVAIPLNATYAFSATVYKEYSANSLICLTDVATTGIANITISNMTLDGQTGVFQGCSLQIGGVGYPANYINVYDTIQLGANSTESQVLTWVVNGNHVRAVNNTFKGNTPVPYISSAGSLGVEVSNGNDILILGNTFLDLYVGVNTHLGNANLNARDLRITANEFDTMDIAESIYAVTTNTLSNYISQQNIIKNMKNRGINFNCANSSSIQGFNTIGDSINNATSGISVNGGGNFSAFKNFNILGLSISNIVTDSVNLNYTSGVKISEFSIFNVAGYGIFIYSSKGLDAGPGRLEGVYYTNVYPNGSSANIKVNNIHCDFFDPGGWGGQYATCVAVGTGAGPVHISGITGSNPGTLDDYVVYLNAGAVQVQVKDVVAQYAAAIGVVYTNSLAIANLNIGSFTAAATTSTTISNTLVSPTSIIRVYPTNAAAADLTGVYVSAKTAGTSFVVTHSSAAGTETFGYEILQ